MRSLSIKWLPLVVLLALLGFRLGIVNAQEVDVNKTLTSMYNDFLSKVKEKVDAFLTGVQELFLFTLQRGLEVLITIARASYLVLGLLGIVLWGTGVSPYRGRHLIVGAVVLAIVTEVLRGVLG